jgi:hypothetical protein
MESSGVISPVLPGMVKSGRGMTMFPILANSYPGSSGFEFALYIGMDIAGRQDIYFTHGGCYATERHGRDRCHSHTQDELVARNLGVRKWG